MEMNQLLRPKWHWRPLPRAIRPRPAHPSLLLLPAESSATAVTHMHTCLSPVTDGQEQKATAAECSGRTEE